jgi:hypothetical protein
VVCYFKRIKNNWGSEIFLLIFYREIYFLGFKYFFLNFLTIGIVPFYIFNKINLTNIDSENVIGNLNT